MAASVNRVLAQMQRWTDAARMAELSDAVLLARYAQQREESAFTALVARYGSLVLRVCRRILGNAQEADDAFQAVFLILSRKAASLKQPETLPAWLHGVARRVALKARRTRLRQRSGADTLSEELLDPHPDPLTQLTAREMLDIVDEEVRRLPAVQRSAVLLCCLQGHTREEAARILGCTDGAVKGHLQRGRQRLQKRLERRGIALSAALTLAAVRDGVAERVPALLLQSMVRAVLDGGIGGTASILAHRVLHAMSLPKLASVLVVTLTVALVASTTVALVYRGSTAEVPEDEKPSVLAPTKDAGASKPKPRTDAMGNPLPDGALRRLGTLRFRHGGGTICNLLLTPDGKTLVSNSYHGSRTVCVWEMATGKLLRQFPGTFDERNIALSSDGKLVAIGSEEKAIFLWDLASGKEIRRIAQPYPTGVAFAPDGETLAAIENYSTIHLWNLESGKKVASLQDKDASLNMLAYTPDGRTLIAGQKFDPKISLWDVASGKKRQQLDAKGGSFFSLALSPDGAILATGSRQGGISLWDMKTGKLIRKLRAESKNDCTGVAFSPNGKTLAAIEGDGKNGDFVSLWNVADGKELPRPKSDIAAFWNIVFAPDGKTLITGFDSTIRLWDLATGKEIGPAAGSPEFVGWATMSPNGRLFAYYRKDEIRLWDMRAGREIGAIDARPNGIQSLAFAPDGRTVAAGVGEHAVNLWDVYSHKLLHRLQWDKKDSPCAYWSDAVAFSPNGRLLASADTKSPAIRLWDLSTGKQIRQFNLSDPKAPKNDWPDPNGVAFSPDGRLLAASGRTGFGSSRVAIWEAATGKALPQLTKAMNDPAQKEEPLHSPGISGFERKMILRKVIFSPNGTMLAKNGRPKTIPIWETASGRQRLLLRGHEESTVCVAFAPDNRTLASASWDNTIRLWDLHTGHELRKLTGHRGRANSLAFSADSKILVSTGEDTTILFWDVADVTGRKNLQAAPLDKRQWQALWEDLAKEDAAKAYAAMVRMAADAPTTIAALKDRLHPLRLVDPERLARLLKEMDSDEFAVREAASRELVKLGDVVEPAVRRMLARPDLSLELRRRLEAIAASLDETSGVRLRPLRALEVLEMLGTAEARELLRAMAAGASGARLTEQAKSALQRSTKRGGK